MRSLDVTAAALVVVGGLNWGLVGLLGVDAVAAVFGDMAGPSRILYALVGLGALYQGVAWPRIQRRWQPVARRRALISNVS